MESSDLSYFKEVRGHIVVLVMLMIGPQEAFCVIRMSRALEVLVTYSNIIGEGMGGGGMRTPCCHCRTRCIQITAEI